METLVKEKIPIPDGRPAFCLAVLPVAIKEPETRSGKLSPLVTREEAIEWLRKSIERYPDPEKDLDGYVEKLEYNLKYGEEYNIPTWKHLVEERTENGKLAEVFLHIKHPTIYALTTAGYVKLSQEQLDKFKKNYKTQPPP